MPREHTIRLRESAHAPAREAKVIDAQYSVVRGPKKKRGFWGRMGVALVAAFWAAVIGFAIPQAWIFAENVGAFFAANG